MFYFKTPFYGVGGWVAYIDPYQDPYEYHLSTSEVLSIHPEYVAIILTSSTIAAIRISVYSPLNILFVVRYPRLVPGCIECKLV